MNPESFNTESGAEATRLTSLWITFRNILGVVLVIFVFAVIQMLTLRRVCDSGMKTAHSLEQHGLPGLELLASLQEHLAMYRLYSYEILFARDLEKPDKTRAIQVAEAQVQADLQSLKTHFPREQGRLVDELQSAFDDLRTDFTQIRRLEDQDFAAAMKVMDEQIPPRVERVAHVTGALRSAGSDTFTKQATATFGSFGWIKGNAVLFGAANIIVTFSAVVFVMLAARRARLQLSDAWRRLGQQTRELAASLATVHATLESTADGILMIEATGGVGNYNHQFLKMWQLPELSGGLPAERVTNHLLAALRHPDAFRHQICLLQEHPEMESSDVLELSDGRTIECHSRPQRIDGRALGRVWSFRDVTERHRAEQERRLMDIQLRQAQKLESIGQLAAGIAHEINTPTQYVGDNTRFIQQSFHTVQEVCDLYRELLEAARTQGVAPELIRRIEAASAAGDLDYLFRETPEAIAQTLEGVERVTRIVRAMKEFSHPGGKDKAAADLNKAIETTTTVARNEWKYVANLDLQLDPTLPPVPCFLGEFNQCVLNLVVNAAHAIGDATRQMPGSKGTITIRTRRLDEQAEVRVSDTGTGIPEPARARIFEPFFTTKEVGKGTGQGLSIVYSTIVKKHGGTVRFETETGKGTSFILCLPLVSPPPETRRETGMLQPQMTGGRLDTLASPL